MQRLRWNPLLLMALALGACGTSKDLAKIDYTATCPAPVMRVVQQNQDALQNIQVGVTRWQDLTALGRPVRRVALSHPGAADLTVAFYLTGAPECPLLQPTPTLYQPVVMDETGLILGYGLDTMQDLHAQGWRLRDTAWQWQSYNYAYLPAH